MNAEVEFRSSLSMPIVASADAMTADSSRSRSDKDPTICCFKQSRLRSFTVRLQSSIAQRVILATNSVGQC